MVESPFRLDWSRPVSPSLPHERAYHATNGTRHILVILADRQLVLADRLANARRAEDPDTTVQGVIEDAINRAWDTRSLPGGEVRLADEDFA